MPHNLLRVGTHLHAAVTTPAYLREAGYSFDASSEVGRGGGLGPCDWRGEGQEKGDREVHLLLLLLCLYFS